MTSKEILQIIQQELDEQGYDTHQTTDQSTCLSAIITNPQNNLITTIWIWEDNPYQMAIYNLTMDLTTIDLTEPNAVTQLFNEIQKRIGTPKHTENHDINPITTNDPTRIK